MSVATDHSCHERSLLGSFGGGFGFWFRRQSHHARALVIPGQQDSSISVNILQRDPSRRTEDQTLTARESNRVDAPFSSRPGSGKPDLVSVRRPCEPSDTFSSGGENLSVAGKIDNRNGAAVIGIDRMVKECDVVAFGRDPDMAHPIGRLVQNVTDGKFETLLPASIVDCG
jgi:hypothetical protein